MSEQPSRLINWWIPAAVLVTAIALLVGLRAVMPGDSPLPWGPDAPESAVINAVAETPADPFRYGGRPLGTVLPQFGPGGPDWQDSGWEVAPRTQGGFRVTRRFVAPGGGRAGVPLHRQRRPGRGPAGQWTRPGPHAHPPRRGPRLIPPAFEARAGVGYAARPFTETAP